MNPMPQAHPAFRTPFILSRPFRPPSRPEQFHKSVAVALLTVDISCHTVHIRIEAASHLSTRPPQATFATFLHGQDIIIAGGDSAVIVAVQCRVEATSDKWRPDSCSGRADGWVRRTLSHG